MANGIQGRPQDINQGGGEIFRNKTFSGIVKKSEKKGSKIKKKGTKLKKKDHHSR